MTNHFNTSLRMLTRVLLAVVLVALTCSLAQAEARWWTQPRVIEGLGLTQGQIDAIDDLAFAWQEKKIALEADAKRAGLELRRVLSEDPLDEGAADAANERLAEAKCAILRGDQVHRLEIAKLLSLDQRQKLERLLDTVKEKRGERLRELRRNRAERAPSQ